MERETEVELFMIHHDVTSPRPNIRFNMITGTKGMYVAGPSGISTSHEGYVSEEEFRELVEKYTPGTTKRFEELTRQEFGGIVLI